MDIQEILNRIYLEVKPLVGKGNVADYIPALAKVDPGKFGMSVTTVDGKEYRVGDSNERFSIQSISKVFTLSMAMQLEGDKLWERVGLEPSGTRFNSLVQLEFEKGKPRNPFINAGAIVISDAILKKGNGTKEELLSFVQHLAQNKSIRFNEEVASSEKQTGNRNFALGYFLKSFDNLKNEVDEVLDLYFHQCSIEMSCSELSHAFIFLANRGRTINGKEIISQRQAKRINALMLTCGLYDAVGDFAYWVGLPGKSGVGGGIVATMPGQLSVAVWSPCLNENGNSLAGTKALELFTTYLGESIF